MNVNILDHLQSGLHIHEILSSLIYFGWLAEFFYRSQMRCAFPPPLSSDETCHKVQPNLMKFL